jgi:membrane fusion protein (multidrug efflux system)
MIPLLLLVCPVLTACGDRKNQHEAPPMLVAAHDVVAEDVPWPAEYQAQAAGSRAVEVRARVQAIIEKRLYKEGDFVKEGQQLFQLERDQYEARMQQAEAQYDSAEREWKRVRPLYEKNAVSQKERDNARAAYESAKAELRQAKINLDYCQVVSPVSGYSSKENVTPGNLVNNNSLLTHVNQTDPMYIDFSIAAPEYMRRRNLALEGRLAAPPGNRYKARLRLLDGSMHPGEGEVTFIDSQVQPGTGVIKARAVFSNAEGRIMPGQYVRLYMEGDILKNAILIPQKCVLLTQQGALVMALDAENKVSARNVTLGVAIGDRYLVDSGLKGGERIISEGIIKARPGAVVRVRRSGDGAEQNPSARK